VGGFGLHSVFAVHMKVCSLAVAQDLQMDDNPSITMSEERAKRLKYAIVIMTNGLRKRNK